MYTLIWQLFSVGYHTNIKIPLQLKIYPYFCMVLVMTVSNLVPCTYANYATTLLSGTKLDNTHLLD